jgi:hypothetical protein
MARVFAFAVASLGVALALALGVAFGCSNSPIDGGGDDGLDGGTTHRDSAPVDPSEAGAVIEGGPTVTPSCTKYCDLVMTNCTGDNLQYLTYSDCLAFCDHLPLEQAARDPVEKEAASVACRQYWADSPARTDPKAYCLSAGPFGGNTCGDRCTAYCDVVLDACSTTDLPPYPSRPECASACANFSYRDAGADGGGEGPTGPETGDTLNCRLFRLRAATKNPAACGQLRPDGGYCEQK